MHQLNDLACCKIERLRSIRTTWHRTVRLAQHTFRTIPIDIEAQDDAAQLWRDDHTAGTGVAPSSFFRRLCRNDGYQAKYGPSNSEPAKYAHRICHSFDPFRKYSPARLSTIQGGAARHNTSRALGFCHKFVKEWMRNSVGRRSGNS